MISTPWSKQILAEREPLVVPVYSSSILQLDTQLVEHAGAVHPAWVGFGLQIDFSGRKVPLVPH